MHRHRKTDLFKKDGMTVDPEREDKKYRQEFTSEGSSYKSRNSVVMNMDVTSNKFRGAFKMSNGESKVPVLEVPRHLVPWAGQTSNNSSFMETMEQVEAPEELLGNCMPAKGESVTSVSTPRKRVEASNISNCLNGSSPYVQHVRPETTAVKGKPTTTLRRDPNIWQSRMSTKESLQNVTETTADISTKPNNLSSLERRHIRSLKPQKEQVPEGKTNLVGCSIPSTKTRSVKHVSSKTSTHLKSHNVTRSLSPALIVDQQSHQASSNELSTRDHKHTKPNADCVRQNQQLLKHLRNTPKTTNVCVEASKSKLEHCQTIDHDHKNVTSKTVSRVSRPDAHVISPASVQSGDLVNRPHADDESSESRSPASVASSKSDTYVCEPRKQRPQLVSQVRPNVTSRPTTEKRLFRKSNCVEKVETDDRSEGSCKSSCFPRNSLSRRDLNPETLPHVDKAKNDADQRSRNTKLVGSAVAQQQKSSERKHVRSQKLNAPIKIASVNKCNDKLKIAANNGNAFLKTSMEENKQDKKPAWKLAAQMHNSISDTHNAAQTIGEAGEAKYANLVKRKQRADRRTNEIIDSSVTDLSCKDEKKTDSAASNKVETPIYNSLDQAEPTPNLVSLNQIIQTASTAKLFCPCSENDMINISHMAGFKPDLRQFDILPVIYFCWQKCTDMRGEEGSPKQDLEQVVSLDQGLSVLRQIMLDATSENTACSQEYTLNQLASKDAMSPTNYDFMKSNDKEILTGACFQLIPRLKNVKSNQIIWSSERTNNSSLTGVFNADSAYFAQEDRQTKLFGNNGDGYPLHPALGEALCGTNDIQTAINISRAIKNSIRQRMNMTTLWTSMTKGIIAFFQHPANTPNMICSDLSADARESSGTTVDQVTSYLTNAHTLENVLPPQEMRSGLVVTSRHPTPVASQQEVRNEQVISEQTESLCPKLATEKRHSERKRTINNDAPSHDERDSSCTHVIVKSKSAPCRNRKASVKEVLCISSGKSAVDCRNTCNRKRGDTSTDVAEVSEQPRQFSNDTPTIKNKETVDSQVVKHHLSSCGKGTKTSENLTVDNSSKESSHYIHSNTTFVKSMRSEKSDRNEMNNIPFSINLYESLEGPNKKPDCNNIFGQQEAAAYCTFENDELEFITHSENCPDPSMDDLEDNTDSNLTAKLSGFGTAGLRQYPHLVWTWRCGQSMPDREGRRPDFESMSCTSDERAEVSDSNWLAHKTQPTKFTGCQEDSLPYIRSKDCVQGESASVQDASVKALNCSVSNEGSCQDLSENLLLETHSTLAEATFTKLGQYLYPSRQHTTSLDIPIDAKKQDDSDVNMKEVCDISLDHSLSGNNTKMSSSTSETIVGSKDTNIPEFDCSRNSMMNATQYEPSVHINPVDSNDTGVDTVTGSYEISPKEDTYSKYIADDIEFYCEHPSNEQDSARERNNDGYISEIVSCTTKTAETSRSVTEHTVNMLAERPYSSDLDITTSEIRCTQDSAKIAVEVSDQQAQSPDILTTSGAKYKQLKKMIGSLVTGKSCVSPTGQSRRNISTDDNVSDGTLSRLATTKQTKQNLTLFCMDNITRAALALKHVSASHVSYLCGGDTATACSELIRVGCSRPLGVTLSNLIPAQQPGRHSQRRMLDQCGSSVDDRTLNVKAEDLVDNNVYNENEYKLACNDYIEHGNNENVSPKVTLHAKQDICNESEHTSTFNDSPQHGNTRQEQQETVSNVFSLQESSSILPEIANINNANQTDQKTDNTEMFSSFGASVSSTTTDSSNRASNNASNVSQKEGSKSLVPGLHLSRMADLLTPSACQSDEGQESGIFSNYSLASPPAPRTVDVENSTSSSESFESVFTKNSDYLKEQTCKNVTVTDLSATD